MSEINPLQGEPARIPFTSIGAEKRPEKSFKEILQPILDDVSSLQQKADSTYVEYLKGNASIDEVVISFRKAQVSFELLLQVRNRLIDTFEELMRMRI